MNDSLELGLQFDVVGIFVGAAPSAKGGSAKCSSVNEICD